MPVIFGNDHDVRLAAGLNSRIFGQIDHRNQRPAQAHHAFHRWRHFRRTGNFRDAHHLAHLEYIDTEGFLASGAIVQAEREHQYLQLVRPGQLGAGINVF